jgi:protease-4
MKSLGRWISAASIALGIGASFERAAAQTPVQRVVRLPAPGRNVVSSDDTSALVLNPANLGFLESSELRYTGVFLDEAARVPWQGNAIGFAFPIDLLSLATGVRLDIVDPPSRASEDLFSQSINYQYFTWGLAFHPTETAALGISWQRSYSDDARAHGLSSWSFGLSTRPFNGVGLAFVAHDFTSPTNSAGTRQASSYDIGLAVRPLGTRQLELALEGKYLDEEGGYWIPRGVVAVDVPPLGTLRAEFGVSDPTEERRERAFVAMGGLSIYLSQSGGSMELGGGLIAGNGIGTDAAESVPQNLYFEAAARGWREPAGPEADYAVRVRVEETPGARGHVALLRGLWALAKTEPNVRAVILELRTAPAESLARVQELRDALFELRRHGKKVLCHLEDNGGSELYLCSAADRVLINPAGGLRFAGLAARYFYMADLLDKLGIRADFVRRGEHKSAPEQFMRMGASDQAKRDKIDLLQQYEREVVGEIAIGRSLSAEVLRRRLASGPFIASEAKAAGLVDGYAFDDQLEDVASALVGRRLSLVEDRLAPRAPAKFGGRRSIALIYVDGDMVDGRSQVIPLLGARLAGSYTLAESIKQARENPEVAAVVLRMETGGGSGMAADVLWREVELTANVKPTIVSMGAVAASAGYYMVTPATRIFANPLTITGSIGVFYGKADIAGLLRKIGVNVEVYKTAPHADIESIFRPFTPEERKVLDHKVEQFYQQFLVRVVQGRRALVPGIDKEQVDRVGRGRVWTGRQAHERRLVDELGGLRQALDHARRLTGLEEDAPILELPPDPTTLLGRLLGIEGLKADASVPLPAQVTRLLRAAAPFIVYQPDRPIARMEVILDEP